MLEADFARVVDIRDKLSKKSKDKSDEMSSTVAGTKSYGGKTESFDLNQATGGILSSNSSGVFLKSNFNRQR